MRVWPSEKKPRKIEGPQEGEYWKPVVLTDIDIPFERMVAIAFTASLAIAVSNLIIYGSACHRHGAHHQRYPSLGRLEGVVY